MKKPRLRCAVSATLLGTIVFVGSVHAASVSKFKAAPVPAFTWNTVVNNNDPMPGASPARNFNSYNQPSVNLAAMVVIRARSRGGSGGQPTHGIYTRDMSGTGNPLVRILDRSSEVPQPNNLTTTFVETPSFPRIDMDSAAIATRGNHQPVWRYVPEGDIEETRVGTTGIYTNPFGDLITGASKLGAVPEFSFFEVPEYPGVLFEVFPGAPSVTAGDTIVFKGNYTAENIARTGVYYRALKDEPIGDDNLSPAGGNSPVVLIANNSSTLIPGTTTVFGSTAPPSAAKGQVVFAGFDNEEHPTIGGLYLAPLAPTPDLKTLVSIGGQVPGESRPATFNGLGEGVAFDGRFVGFWGAWGEATRTVRLYCSTEGNQDRIDYCNQALECEDSGETIGDPNSICDDESDPYYGERCYQEKQVPAHQGVFVHDTNTGKTVAVAKSGNGFDEFLFWNYSGKTPCTGDGHSDDGAEDDGEPARWRSSAFVAVSTRAGAGATFNAAFKARKGKLVGGVYVNPVDGIYLKKWPGEGQPLMTVLDTTTSGQAIDPEAPVGSLITELGIERESLRGRWLTINASMGIEGGSEEEGMAGVYITRVR